MGQDFYMVLRAILMVFAVVVAALLAYVVIAKTTSGPRSEVALGFRSKRAVVRIMGNPAFFVVLVVLLVWAILAVLKFLTSQ